MIELIIMCHYFQKRLSWMLSSLLQQVGDVPKFTINVAYLSGNGNPTTEIVLDEFSSRGLIITNLIAEKKDLAYRGKIRDMQLGFTNPASEWIFFADTDSVYPPTFFNDLNIHLKDPANHNLCISSPYRYDTRVKETNTLLRCTPELYIENAFEKALPLANIKEYSGRLIAAGNMQVVRQDVLKANTGGRYFKDKESHDKNMFSSGMKTRSDMYFRSYFKNNIIKLPYQIHLDHNRYRRYEGVEEQR